MALVTVVVQLVGLEDHGPQASDDELVGSAFLLVVVVVDHASHSPEEVVFGSGFLLVVLVLVDQAAQS